MRPEFADAAAVAQRLVREFAVELSGADAVLVPTAHWEAFAAVRDIARSALRIELARDDDDVLASVPSVTGHIVIVDIGVVTGRSAAAMARAARDGGAQSVLLLVGVLPRSARPALRAHVDGMRSVVSPLGQRDLRWHIGGAT